MLTLIWAVTLLDETLQPVQLAGAALVLAGVTWAQRVGAVTSPPRTDTAEGPIPASAPAISSPGC